MRDVRFSPKSGHAQRPGGREEYTPQFGLSEAIGPPTRSPCDCRSGELITPF
jgi:hypothetical protein